MSFFILHVAWWIKCYSNYKRLSYIVKTFCLHKILLWIDSVDTIHKDADVEAASVKVGANIKCHNTDGNQKKSNISKCQIFY